MVTAGYFEQILFFILISGFHIFFLVSYTLQHIKVLREEDEEFEERYSPTSWASSGRDTILPSSLGALFCLCSWPEAGQGGFPCQGLVKISYLVGRPHLTKTHLMLNYDLAAIAV